MTCSRSRRAMLLFVVPLFVASLYGAVVVRASRADVLAATSGGTLFVADTDPARIELYDAGKPNAAPIGTIASGVLSPYNLAVDGKGTLYVQNGDNSITEYPRGKTRPSRTLRVTGGADIGVFVAVGPDGTVYSANRGADEIYEFAPGQGQLTGILGLPQPDAPATVAVSSTNDVYVGYSRSSVPGNAGVWIFKNGGSPGHDLGIVVTYPGGIAVDRAGNLAVGDAGTQTIGIYKPGASKPSRTISTAPHVPYAFAFNGAGTYLYVVGGKPDGVAVYDYASGKLAWNVTQGLSGLGFTLGAAVDSGSQR